MLGVGEHRHVLPLGQQAAHIRGKVRQHQTVRQNEARLEVRRAMLKAAIAVQLDGKDALKNYPEPYGDGPFGYEAIDGGFELKSKFKYKDQPVTLTVGRETR